MGTRKSVALLLGLGAMIAVLIGCGAAPAAQVPEVQPQPAVQQTVPDAPAIAAPEVEVVEVGYEVGLRAPEFGMSLLDGTKVTTSSIVDGGKPVLLYFHATY